MKMLRGLSFFLIVGILIFSLVAPQSLASESSFSIAWVTDTQYLSQDYPQYFDDASQWIVNNAISYGVKIVVHTGDIVNVGTDLNQWENANHSMGILLDNDVPYCWDAGNHDIVSGSWNGQSYLALNSSFMRSKAYWISDCLGGTSTAVSFNVSQNNFMVVNIRYHANSTVLQWLEAILDAHTESHVIVATHAYLNETCGYGNDGWALSLRNGILANHTNVFMTLSGHYHSSSTANRTVVGNRLELFFDRQDVEGQKGGATVRMLIFDLSQGKMNVKTYDTYAGKLLADAQNDFTMDLPFQAVPEFPQIVFPATFFIITFSYIFVRKLRETQIVRASKKAS